MSGTLKIADIDFLQSYTDKLLSETDPKVVEDGYTFLLKHYNLINYRLSYAQSIWRAHICEDEFGFKNTSRLGAPEERFVIRPGRLNEVRSPVFYASFNIQAALNEIEAKENSFVHVAGYRINEGESIRGGIVGDFLKVHRSGRSTMIKESEDKINEVLSQIPHRVGLGLVYLDAFLAEVLRDRNAKQNDYIHSRILGKLLMQKIKGIQAIFYPSVVSEYALNMAVEARHAHRSMSIVGSSVIRVKKKYSYNIFDYELIRNAIGFEDDGTIVWN